MVDKNARLRYYRETLEKKSLPVPCPHCDQPVLPKCFEKHCAAEHHFNSKRGCPWCRKVFWEGRKKNENADHLIECSKMHLILPRSPPTSTLVASVGVTVILQLLDMCHAFSADDDFGMEHELTEKAHPLPHLADLWDRYPRYCTDDTLHWASVCLRWYLETWQSADWLHVMVRWPAYDAFLACLDDNTYCLPFACWCDGGPRDLLPRHRQHRHMLVVSFPQGRFKKELWPRVKPAEKPKSNFRCKVLRYIVSPLHLVNTMGYLSHRKSQCDFTQERHKYAQGKVYRNYHFFLYKTLPVAFRLPLVLLWPGGVMELLFQELLNNASVVGLVQQPLKYEKGKWHQRLKDLEGLPRGRVLPVLKTLMPVLRNTCGAQGPFEPDPDAEMKDDNQATGATQRPPPWSPAEIPQARTLDAFCLYLGSGRQLSFEANPEYALLDHDTWLAKQAQGGNVFYDAIQDEFWAPRLPQQRELNHLKPFADRIQLLEAEMAVAKEKIHRLESDRAAAKRKTDACQQQHDAQHQAAQAHILHLYAQNEALSTENTKLTQKIHEHYEVQLARLENLVQHLVPPTPC